MMAHATASSTATTQCDKPILADRVLSCRATCSLPLQLAVSPVHDAAGREMGSLVTPTSSVDVYVSWVVRRTCQWECRGKQN